MVSVRAVNYGSEREGNTFAYIMRVEKKKQWKKIVIYVFFFHYNVHRYIVVNFVVRFTKRIGVQE